MTKEDQKISVEVQNIKPKSCLSLKLAVSLRLRTTSFLVLMHKFKVGQRISSIGKLKETGRNLR